eukprot:IDg18236t1
MDEKGRSNWRAHLKGESHQRNARQSSSWQEICLYCPVKSLFSSP